jgi:DNA-binding SARP family transcriptional activator
VSTCLTYSSELFSGSDYQWALPLRAELFRQAHDAALCLAEFELGQNRLDLAVLTLDRAIRIDPYAEDLYRFLMTVQRQAGRHDAAEMTYQQLVVRLSEINMIPDPKTLVLARNPADF